MNTKDVSRLGVPKPPLERGRFPARLHVLLARNAKVALVIRRGPSKSVCTVLWNRERNTFKLGQWMRGRIYERRSDLSPDGKHFIYFAMNGRWESATKGAWEWADYVDGRLVFAVEGQLRSAQLGRGKLSTEKPLHDFNDMKFEALAAPY